MDKLETIKMENLCHKMEISSFADRCYASGFICDICYENYSSPFIIGRWCYEVCHSTKYGVQDQHGKQKSFIFLAHTKRNAEDGVLSFNVIL